MYGYKASEYAVGETIYIFGGYGNDFLVGTVMKVTPSGQLVAKTAGGETRFTPNGREVGGSTWSYKFVLPKAEAATSADNMRAGQAQQKLKLEVGAEMQRLSALNPTHSREELLAGLLALTAKLEGEA